MNKSVRQINEEWKRLPSAPSCSKKCYTTALCNTHLNRYQDVLPFEDTRVKLDSSPNSYLNASYIEVCSGFRCIAAQAPLPPSFDDFWQMIWESHVLVIVMLARFVEKRKVKAHCYWPSSLGHFDTFGDITVSLIKTQHPSEGITIQHFSLTKGTQTRKIIHLHYTNWPDFGVPDRTDDIREIKRIAELYIAKEPVPKENEAGKPTYPILVHCSAGIGRAGTFLAYLNYCQLVQQGAAIDSISVEDIVLKLRTQRMCMVQTKEQYQFIYHLLSDEFSESSGESRNSSPLHTSFIASRKPKPPLRSTRSYCTPRSFLRTTQNGLNTLSISSS